MNHKNNSKPICILQYGMSVDSEKGGVESYLLNQFLAMDHTHVRYDFIAKRDDQPLAYEDKLVKAGAKIYRLPHRRRHPIWHYAKLWRTLQSERESYDAIVVNASDLSLVSILLIARMCGIKCRVYHAHTSGAPRAVTLFRRCFEWASGMILGVAATHLFACSSKAGRWMFGDRRSFTVVKNAVPAEQYAYSERTRNAVREQLDIRNNYVVGMVGNFTLPKNHVFGLKVFEKVLARRPSAKLLIVGCQTYADDLSWRKFNNCLAEMPADVRRSVLMLGHRDDVYDIMQAMDCLLMPSFFEGLPVVGVEAQFAGLPCFFSNAITEEVSFSEGCRFLSLDEGCTKWAEAIEMEARSLEPRRKLSLEQVRASGFDAVSEANRVAEFFRLALRRTGGRCE